MSERTLGPTDVDMHFSRDFAQKASRLGAYEEADEIMIHYTVTEACPFSCRGCINALTAGKTDGDRAVFLSGPKAGEDVERDIKGIAELIRTSGKPRAVIVFYGGEPMLRLDKMNRVYEQLGALLQTDGTLRFVVITSGHFLKKAIENVPGMTSNMWLTAVSVDGTAAQHEGMRRGTSLETIRDNVASLNEVRKGSVLIWSTLRPGMDLWNCFQSFMTFREQGHAEHFFWHCDEAEETIPDMQGYLHMYRQALEKIMGVFVEFLGRGDLLSIVHVNELLLYLLTGAHRGASACGVERMANFDIIGDGKIHGCADLPQAMSIGTFTADGGVQFDPDARERLAGLVSYKEELGCAECGVEPYCGGRCPVQIHTGGLERARQYCYVVRQHVRTVKRHAPDIVDRMLEHGMTLEHLYRSARYAKFTDVMP